MARMQSKAAARETVEEDEEPTERVLKSRKFRDDEPRKEKPARRGRRGDDEDDDRGDRRSRRDRDFEEDVEIDRRGARKANRKEAKEAEKKAQRAAERAAQQAEQKNQIKLPEFISVQNLAQALGVRYEQFVTRLEDLGYDDIFPGKIFNTEVSGMIAMEYEMEPVFDSSIREEEERDLKARPAVDEQEKDLLPTRPPLSWATSITARLQFWTICGSLVLLPARRAVSHSTSELSVFLWQLLARLSLSSTHQVTLLSWRCASVALTSLTL
jgi:translation initiation factor IF-2